MKSMETCFTQKLKIALPQTMWSSLNIILLICIYIYMYIRIYIYIYQYIWNGMHMYIYTYIHTYHIQIYTMISAPCSADLPPPLFHSGTSTSAADAAPAASVHLEPRRSWRHWNPPPQSRESSGDCSRLFFLGPIIDIYICIYIIYIVYI